MPVSGNLRSILAMLLAVVLFSCMDAMLKVLSGAYPPFQVTALRGLMAVPWVLGYVLWRRELGVVFSRRLRWRLHLLRGVIGVLMMALFTFGLRTLGLAEAYTLTFVAPLLITVLAAPILQEAALPRHWIALAVGLVGVVVALRPYQDPFFSIGSVAILASAVCYPLSSVLGRLISRSEPSVTLDVLDHLQPDIGRQPAGRRGLGRHPPGALAGAAGARCDRHAGATASPRPSATGRPRRSHPSSIPRWSGPWRWTGSSGGPCPMPSR